MIKSGFFTHTALRLLLSVADGLMLVLTMKALCGTLVTTATTGRVQIAHLRVLITYSRTLRTSIRQATAIVGMLSPSAASTQVVPNGGKGKRRCKNNKFMLVKIS